MLVVAEELSKPSCRSAALSRAGSSTKTGNTQSHSPSARRGRLDRAKTEERHPRRPVTALPRPAEPLGGILDKQGARARCDRGDRAEIDPRSEQLRDDNDPGPG